MVRTLFAFLYLFFAFFAAFPQQCTFPSKIYLPIPDNAADEGYATSVDVHNNYMVTGAYYNDSLDVDAGVTYVYKLNSSNQWERIAELVPSDVGRRSWFGRIVSIVDNTIAVWGRTYDEDGNATVKIYIYERSVNGEWTSGIETYQLPGVTSIVNFSLHKNELVVVGYFEGKIGLKIFKKSGGIYSLDQTIDVPVDKVGRTGNFGDNLVVSDDFIVVGAAEFRNDDNTSSVVFVYQKNAGVYEDTPSRLRPSTDPSSGSLVFAKRLTANNSAIFVEAANHPIGTDLSEPVIYIYEKPSTGWTNGNESVKIISEQPIYFDFQIAATEDYFFITGPGYESILGFKKTTSTWSSGLVEFKISHPTSKTLFGYQIQINEQHLVVGAPERPNHKGSDEYIVDFFAPTGEWENISSHNQIVRGSANINATDDYFGDNLAVYRNHLAITARGDDETGTNTGSVYIFNTDSPESASEKIFSPEAQSLSGFSRSLDIGDSILFIGAPSQDSLDTDEKVLMYAMGKVFVYRLTSTGWTFHSQIIAPVVKNNGYFGQNITCSPGYVAITEYYEGSSESRGQVHIYKESSSGRFLYLATLKPSEELGNNHFGSSVLMNDSLIVVGTGGGETSIYLSMKVFIYSKKGEWKNATEDAYLISSSKKYGDFFGYSLAMADNYIVVGAPGWRTNTSLPVVEIYRGAAYIFKMPPGGWKGKIEEIAQLLPSDPADYSYFGASVGIDHSDIFVGSPNTMNDGTPDLPTHQPGKVYHYKKNTHEEWISSSQELRQLVSFEPENRDGYGNALLISDRYLYTGAVFDSTASGIKSGSVQTLMQLPVIEPLRIHCNDENPVALTAFPSAKGVWSGRGIDTVSKTFSPKIAGVGIHSLTYTISGCSAMTIAEVIKSDLEILEKSDTALTKCIGDTVKLIFNTNADEEQYNWYYRENEDSLLKKIDSAKKEINTNKPGLYTAEIIRSVCPVVLENFNLSDDVLIDIVIESVPVVCSNEPYNLQVIPEGGIWSGIGVTGNGVLTSAELTNGEYTQLYQYSTEQGCIWKDSVIIIVDKLRLSKVIQEGDKICGETPVVLKIDSTDANTTTQWFNIANNEIVGNGSFLNIKIPGTYSAIVSKHECSLETDSFTITAQSDSLYVPNLFTPNSDSFNDQFEIKSDGLEDFNIRIINRYGRPVFEANDPDFKWEADNLPAGVYFWRITYLSCSQRVREHKGWVQISK